LKILIINDHATWTGGAEILTLAMRDGLRSRVHDCRIFASSDRPLNAELLADYRCYGTSSRFRTLLQTTDLSALWQLGRILNEFQR
jgi:hypothetical protein